MSFKISFIDSAVSAVVWVLANVPEDSKICSDFSFDLALSVKEAIEYSEFDRKKFLPEGEISKIITRETIRKTIPKPSNALVDFIHDSAPKIFVIMLFRVGLRRHRLRKAAKHFHQYGFTDSCLPITDSDELWTCQKSSTCDRPHMKPLHAFRILSPIELEIFIDYQWTLFAPVFSPSSSRLKLDSNTILPVTWTSGKPPKIALKELLGRPVEESYRAETAFEVEATALDELCALNHPNLVKRVASFTRGQTHYFLFEWAGGGNLREFWRASDNDPSQLLSGEFLKDVIRQLRGLADAICALHNLKDSESWRHGDLKPENILRHLDSDDPLALGVLQICDFGLAKRHNLSTGRRSRASTIAFYGTDRYKPPEAVIWRDEPRSRLYDIWSMGCIIMEFVIWLLYGTDELQRFHGSLDESLAGEGPFFILEEPKAKLRPAVMAWLDHMRTDIKSIPNPALEDLLLLVEHRLLVVDLPNESGARSRATASQLLYEMDQILLEAENIPDYLPTGTVRIGRHGPPPKQRKGKVELHPPDNIPSAKTLNDHWEYDIDNTFATKILDLVDPWGIPSQNNTTPLCEKCQSLAIDSPAFTMNETVSSFRDASKRCRLCKLFYDCIARRGNTGDVTVRFKRSGSGLQMNGSRKRTLSICRILGFPTLPKPRTDVYFDLIRQWLRDCDDKHDCISRYHSPMPTRLIDVGQRGAPTVHLHYTNRNELGVYVALSHRWGDDTVDGNFRTTSSMIDKLKQGFDLKMLPKTFQDTVEVTREIKVRFLWIDSICIIQDDSTDWETESRRMEQVFSSAYCVLAAGSSGGTSDGFLHAHPQRDVVALESISQDRLYVCDSIDNFHDDVEQGELNKRGWVLQERALSRRTLHFTGKQMYWECGEGVRCQTLTKMRNSKSGILGDSHFPRVALKLADGGKMRVYQFIYEKYSRLAFTHPWDRPVAIIGLENRLLQAFGTRGKYGILECFLHRSLLWQRGRDEIAMRRIAFPHSRKVPSWSWLAYQGGISYMEVPPNNTDWNAEISDAFRDSAGNSSYSGDVEALGKLEVKVYDCDMSGIYTDDPKPNIIFDDPGQQEHCKSQCIIVGREISTPAEKMQGHYYVLFVTQKSTTEFFTEWERFGVGILPKKCFDWESAERLGEQQLV
ncbi:hypothetical protein F5Y10DRAFT_262869 [Nemania abortiva]|nr:hypothetical protein F5Y10DRAFT_262869 [Nemania abortiva]